MSCDSAAVTARFRGNWSFFRACPSCCRLLILLCLCYWFVLGADGGRVAAVQLAAELCTRYICFFVDFVDGCSPPVDLLALPRAGTEEIVAFELLLAKMYRGNHRI